MAAKISAELLEEVPSLTTREKDQIHVIMKQGPQASRKNGELSRETMNTYPSSLQEAESVAVDQATIDAINAAAPGGFADVDAARRGIISKTLFDEARIEGATVRNETHAEQPAYRPEVVEAKVQAAMAAQEGIDPDFADVLGDAKHSKDTFQYPMSPEVRNYVAQVEGGQTTGVFGRFSGELIANGTVDAIEKVVRNDTPVTEGLLRATNGVMTLRQKYIGSSRGANGHPAEVRQ